MRLVLSCRGGCASVRWDDVQTVPALFWCLDRELARCPAHRGELNNCFQPCAFLSGHIWESHAEAMVLSPTDGSARQRDGELSVGEIHDQRNTLSWLERRLGEDVASRQGHVLYNPFFEDSETTIRSPIVDMTVRQHAAGGATL
jgi:hypothetical protein